MPQELSTKSATHFPNTRHPKVWQEQDSPTKILFLPPKSEDCREETRLGRKNPADLASHAFAARQTQNAKRE